MFYVQLVDFCNMSCAHCMMNSHNKRRGDSMSHEVFAKVVDLCGQYSGSMVLGGGEPTLHKHFFDFLDFALRNNSIENTYVITNGKMKKKALKLLKYKDLYSSEQFGCQLSLDSFHDPIDEDVIDAFKAYGKYTIRTVDDNSVIPQGGALENQLSTVLSADLGCHCEEIVVTPTGDIKLCACETAPVLGNILEMTSSDFSDLQGFRGDVMMNDGEEPCWTTLSKERRQELLEIMGSTTIMQQAA